MIFSNKFKLLFLLTLFSSALQAMEPAGFDIMSIDGQKVIIPLDLAKKSSFLSGLIDGGTLNVQEDIPATDIVPLLTADNIRMLRDLYTGIRSLENILEEEIPTMFKLAHWLYIEHDIFNTPAYEKSILSQLAQRCFDFLAKTHDPKLLETRELARDFITSYHTVNNLITTKSITYLEKLYDPAHGTLDLSYARLGKKLKSLEGIEELIHMLALDNIYQEENEINPVVILDLNNQDLTTINFAVIKKYFPKIRQINLSGNRISSLPKVFLKSLPSECMLNLRNNHISEIEEGCFDAFDCFNQNIIHLEGNPLASGQIQEAMRNDAITRLLNPATNIHLSQYNEDGQLNSNMIFIAILGIGYFANYKAKKSITPYLSRLEKGLEHYWKKFSFLKTLDYALHYYRTNTDPILMCVVMRAVLVELFRIGRFTRIINNPYCNLFTLEGYLNSDTSLPSSIGHTILDSLSWHWIQLLSNRTRPYYSPDIFKAYAAIKTPYHLYITTDHGNFDFPSMYSL